MSRSSLTVLIVSTLLLPGEARSQEQPKSLSPVAVGTRVRLRAPTVVRGRIEGLVMEMDETSLLIIEDDNRLRVPRQAITQLDVSTGKRRRALKGMIVGAGIGAVVLGAMGGVGTAGFSHGEAALLGLGTGAAYGVGIGALIKSDRWSAVPLEKVRVSLTPTQGRGVRLSLSVQL